MDAVEEECYAMIALRESHLPQGIKRDLLDSAPFFCTIVWVSYAPELWHCERKME
jgi:hypothetical protein